MGKLIYLRHLDIRGTKLTEMPTQMSMLKDLQCLAYFVVGKNRGSRISGLKELCHLGGKLEILGLENVVSGQDALEALMKDKKHLKQLELKWGGDANDSTKERDVLDKLQPHIGLKSLGIFNYGGTKFPNWLDGAHSLRNIVSLQLTRCTNCYFLPSIGQLPSLKYLKIDGMKQITKVGREFYEDASSSSSIKPFQSLELLSFKQMEEWEEWHALGAGEFSCLLRLYLVDCPKLTGELCTRFPCLRKLEISKCQRLVSHQVGLLLQGLPSLQDLKMSDMKNLTELPQQLQNLSTLQKLEISRMQNLKEFPPELCGLIKLERLKIAICPSLVSILDTGLPPMLKTLEIKECEALQTTTVAAAVGLPHPTLKELVIDECRSLEFPLPEETELNFNKSIEVLGITGRCHLLKSLPLGFFPNLRSLNIRGGKNFETLSISDCEFQNLMEFRIGDYPRMVSFSQGGLAAPNLTYFSVSHCKNLKSLPQRMPTLLPSLEVLLINNCPEIESFPDGGLPSNLRELVIQHNCEKLVKGRMGWGLQTLQSLEKFTITGEYKEVLESFPEEWLLPTTLTNLCLWWLSNLNSLNHKGLQHLTSLTHLRMHKCGKFQSLPEEGLPNSLSHLYISKCPLLKPRCQSVKGEDWPIISRIRHIRMDDEDIVNLE
ncbi:putative disease resistance protein At3g14460 [Cornus florida]|uniref:putative disease resistance protein At3g14460 n=1 Tax=Cornus florida TaxID=4283 RepID=UPI0028A2AD92|nr:putative disease resistance protein At3g14460 [Cornus florida]